jgi:hypothetical protein
MFELDVWIEGLKQVQFRDNAALQAKGSFDDTSNSSSGFSVSNIPQVIKFFLALQKKKKKGGILVFTAPSINGESLDLLRPSTVPAARISMVSPRSVPVPCASNIPMLDGCMPALLSAVSITRSCAAREGAVNPLLFPSWLTATPQLSVSKREARKSQSYHTANN